MNREKTGYIKRSIIILVFIALGFSLCASSGAYTVSAQTASDPTPTPGPAPDKGIPSRHREITYEETTYVWALSWWDTGELACKVFLREEGLPSLSQVRLACGVNVHDEWRDTPPCNTPNTPKKCDGLVLTYQGEYSYYIEETIDLPLPSVEVSLVNCPAWGICEQMPQLSFSGHEPAEGYEITAVHVRIGSETTTCYSSMCILDMPLTEEQGVRVEYWADSSYGDETTHHTFRMRSLETSEGDYRFELLGTQWASESPPCALTWDIFPDLIRDGQPWGEELETPEDLVTDHPLALLAGNLIWYGQVNASSCPDNGLLDNGAANACGLEVANALVLEHQNRYNEAVLTGAQSAHVPPRAIKGIIGQESQFWPLDTEIEYGLGKLTEGGVDMLLSWNVPYFLNLCLPLYGEDHCAAGYTEMEDTQREALRGQVLTLIGSDQEIEVLAEALSASCGQTGQLVKNVSGQPLNKATNYDELWRITLGLYHAGAGCIGEALEGDWAADDWISWDSLIGYLPRDCDLADDYVYRVMYYGQIETVTGTEIEK